MKNVFKRCLKLITLFESSDKYNLDSNYIKDNISDYRDLTDTAFKRSFERDKSILKEIGFNLEYDNDKWNLNEGYSIKGTSIINDLQKNSDFDLPFDDDTDDRTYLNALEKKGVHIVTVNDYLAKRDSIEMGEIYNFLGLTSGFINNYQDDTERKKNYNCDITYATVSYTHLTLPTILLV